MPMSDHVDRYVAIKRALGYSFIDQALVLKRFAAFAAGDEFLNTARVITWASLASSGFLRSSSNCRRSRWRSASMA